MCGWGHGAPNQTAGISGSAVLCRVAATAAGPDAHSLCVCPKIRGNGSTKCTYRTRKLRKHLAFVDPSAVAAANESLRLLAVSPAVPSATDSFFVLSASHASAAATDPFSLWRSFFLSASCMPWVAGFGPRVTSVNVGSEIGR